jgi:hypothetical protein
MGFVVAVILVNLRCFHALCFHRFAARTTHLFFINRSCIVLLFLFWLLVSWHAAGRIFFFICATML